MATPILIPAFTSGEIAPNLFGRQDLARSHTAATTMRNMFVSYKGGAYSRPGTRFVGWAAQFGRPFPPRLIPFQFSINQGLILEFGNHYMRVIQNGAQVTENPIPITNVTNANPGIVTAGAASGSTATPINTAVFGSYKPGDTITLAGGVFTVAAVLTVTHTKLLTLSPHVMGSGYAPADTITLAGGTAVTAAIVTVSDTALASLALNAAGTGYVPGDTITLAGGTPVTKAVVTVATTKVVSATVAAGGTGGTPGTQTVTGTTGAGTKFQASVTVSGGGAITAVGSITVGGSYTTNPTAPATEPVTGASLVGAELDVVLGVNTFTITTPGDYTANSATFTQDSTSGIGTGATFQTALFGALAFTITTAGDYTANPAGNAFTQASSSGSGTGATFQSAGFGVLTATFSTAGVYTTLPTNPVAQASSSGGGFGVTFTITWSSTSANGLVTGDWVFISGVGGMWELNGQTFIVTVLTATTFSLNDVFGNPINTTSFPAYTSGGTIARIFTLPTIYSDADLEWLKVVQSADVMTICCVNQITGTEYPPQDLSRFSDIDWVFTPVVPASSIVPPAVVTATASAGGAAFYAYCVTAIARDGTESIASPIVYLDDAVDVAATAGSITISWTTVHGAINYNIYKAQVDYTGRPPVGVLFGFAGTAFGAQFVDTNIVADFQQVPPLHRDPFVRGQIIGADIDNTGTGYTNATVGITTGTGSGAIIEAIIVSGGVVALLVVDNGGLYLPGDTITITGDGVGATGHLTIGPENGTYPGVPSYFQQRRVFGNTLNNPDTYFMSQPGAFINFDSRIPTIASDAITGTPWSLQVNGLQFFVLMPAGLAAFTGLSAWLLVGSGSFATNVQPISPSSQVAQPLAFSGCSPTLPPIKINYDILYVASKGSYYYDLPYQLYALSEPIDLTMFSSHLFDDFTMREHTWAETPYKLVWSIRSDGALLSLTYLKQQQVAGWARHDTNGKFWSVASCVEPVIATPELGDLPGQKTDAVYFVVERHAG